jgi:hypothetical protein
MSGVYPIPTTRGFKDLTGQRFGKWTVVAYAGKRVTGAQIWRCRCDCGNQQIVQGASLVTGRSSGCRCCAERRHGHAIGKGSRTYWSWVAMRSRCYNSRASRYERYGGRGIKVCARWLGSFENFLADMGERPVGQTLDRINNDGDYEPGNCRWATPRQQSRHTRTNRMLTSNGETRCISEWVEVTGLPRTVIETRLRRGLSGERVLAPLHS